jgi:hypothetical protein
LKKIQTKRNLLQASSHGLLKKLGSSEIGGSPPALEKIIQADQHPPDPEQVKAEVKPLTQQAVRKVVAEIAVRKVQPDNGNHQRSNVQQGRVPSKQVALQKMVQQKQQQPYAKDEQRPFPPVPEKAVFFIK